VLLSPAVTVGAKDSAPPEARPGPALAKPALSDEDLEVLENLELLMELEMLRTWDPDEELPIPVSGDGG